MVAGVEPEDRDLAWARDRLDPDPDDEDARAFAHRVAVARTLLRRWIDQWRREGVRGGAVRHYERVLLRGSVKEILESTGLDSDLVEGG